MREKFRNNEYLLVQIVLFGLLFVGIIGLAVSTYISYGPYIKEMLGMSASGSLGSFS